MRKVVHYVQIWLLAKFEYFWTSKRCLNLISKFGEISNIGKYFTGLSPPVNGSFNLLTVHASPGPVRTHHRTGHHPVAALTSQQTSPPVAATPRGRAPTSVGPPLSLRMGWQRKPCTISPPLLTPTPLCSTHSSPHQSITVATTVPVAPSPSKLANRTACVPSSRSTSYELVS
jgi:hypothetical protein